MLCIARVNLQDWPEGHVREVDETDEGIIGKLRGGYLVPFTRIQPDSSRPPVSADEPPEQTAVIEDGPDASQDDAHPAKRARRKPA